MVDLIPIALVVFVAVVVGGSLLTMRHHRRTWGDGRHGQEPRTPYEPKIWFGQGQG